MKENKCMVTSDGICVYINVWIRNSIPGKIALAFAAALILLIALLAAQQWIPGLLIMSLLILIFLTRYALWTFYGKENVIINTRSVKYQHDYGFFKLPPVTKPLNRRLYIKKIPVDGDKDIKACYLEFISYNEYDLPIVIYTMTLAISNAEAELVIVFFDLLYMDRIDDDYGFQPTNPN